MLVENGPFNTPRPRPGTGSRPALFPAASQTRICAPLQWRGTHRDHALAPRGERGFDRAREAVSIAGDTAAALLSEPVCSGPFRQAAGNVSAPGEAYIGYDRPIARRSAPERPHSTGKAHAKVGWPADFIGDIKGLGLLLGLP